MTTMKKIGDLGNVKFSEDLPKDWPKEKDDMRCADGQIGAYALYNHLDLYHFHSIPAYKPIVLHEKRDDLGTSEKRRDGNSGPGIACGLLKCSEKTKKAMDADPGWKKDKEEEEGGGSSKEGEGGEQRSPLEV